VLLFDIDGTLMRSGGAGQAAMELALEEEFGLPQPFGTIETAGRTDCGIVNELFQRHGLTDSPAERDRFRRSYLERLPQMLRRLPGGPLPGVRELLETVAAVPDVHLALLTGNYAEGAWIKLRHFGLDRYFSCGGFGDDHPDRDDVARVALAAAAGQLQRPVIGPQCLVIGDTPADVRCARAIGARVAAVATGMYSFRQLEPCQPDWLFESLADTDDVVRKLLDGAAFVD
jgi:phosphoglycolate phosphatase